jgi:hypothetical protein
MEKQWHKLAGRDIAKGSGGQDMDRQVVQKE